MQSVTNRCMLFVNVRTRMRQEATSPEATNLLRGFQILSALLCVTDRWHGVAMAQTTCNYVDTVAAAATHQHELQGFVQSSTCSVQYSRRVSEQCSFFWPTIVLLCHAHHVALTEFDECVLRLHAWCITSVCFMSGPVPFRIGVNRTHRQADSD